MRFRVVACLGAAFVAAALATAQTAPARLSDAEFQRLIADLSEPAGTFVTENIVSNEIAFQDVLPELQRRDHQGAYIGVAPEQNLSYIAALRPPIAFILDVQRGNLLLHLMYKALVEMSSDRAEFLSRLFSRPRPPNVGADALAVDLFAAYAAMPISPEIAASTLPSMLDRLTHVHGLTLSAKDRDGIARIYRAMYEGGPNLRGDFGRNASLPSWVPSYAEMMTQADPNGRNQSFLGSESTFATLRTYESNNLIVPVIGDFAGPKALRAIGAYLTQRHIVVGTFYASNVEEYLFRTDAWKRFFANLQSLPLDDQTMFVRTYFTQGIEGMRELMDPIKPMLLAFARGEVRSYDDVVTRSRVPRP